MIAYLKKILIPTPGEKTELEALETWTVSWQTRGEYGRGVKHMQIFTSRSDAVKFSDALEEAANILSGDKVYPEIQRNNI